MEDMIAQKREELGGKIADGIVNNLEQQFKSIDAAFERAMAPSNNAVASAQGSLEGLSRYGVSKGVPDYVRVLAQKKVNQAQEAQAQSAIVHKKTQLDQTTAAAGTARSELIWGAVTGSFTSDQATEAQQKVTDLTSKMDTLTASYLNMTAQANAPSMIVTSLTGNLQQALQAWQEVNVGTKNYNQLLSEEVGPALDQLKGSFTSFFSDIMSGTVSVGTAFGNLAKSIIRSIQDIIAKLIATKLIELLTNLALSFVGGSSSAGGSSSGTGTGASLAFLHAFNGGPVQVPGRARGGKIMTGVPGRDSSLYNLARDEWVVRGAAAKSVGDDFMRDLNNNGAKAVNRRSNMAVLPPPAHQEVKVYVVAPQEKPTMGPNDVTVHMQQEMLRDGATKKIIKHISQGG